MSDEQINAADAATATAVEAALTNAPPEKTEEAFNRSSIEHQRSAAAAERIDPDQWRDGQETLAPMPADPVVTSETDAAVMKLQDLGGRHADLVTTWGADAPVNIEYARAAYREVAASDPELIAAVDRSGLGDHPSVLEFLSKQGRLSAGLMGDHTISRRNNDLTNSPMASAKPRAATSAQEELHQIMADHPPGSDSYRTPSVQRRVEALSRQIAGGGNVVGQGGRYA